MTTARARKLSPSPAEPAPEAQPVEIDDPELERALVHALDDAARARREGTLVTWDDAFPTGRLVAPG